MNFDKNSSEIQEEFLQQIPDNYEKRQGFPLWDILKAIAIRLSETYSKLTAVAEKLDVENLVGDELERFVNQRTGIERRQATFSQGELTVEGAGSIQIGSLFETEGQITFISLEDITITDTATIQIQALNSGANGDVPANTIIKMPITIAGIHSCYNVTETVNGFDAESDNDLRERYYERLREPATSGNIYHYKLWAKEVEGVGDAKVIPLWAGHNTVKVIIIDADRLPASDILVSNVQNYIDPNSTGEGVGEAPIGAMCTVVSAVARAINIDVKIYKVSTIDSSTLKLNLEYILTEYLKEIAFQRDTLSYAIIGSKVLDVDGIIDYSELQINGTTINIECLEDEVFVLGEVNFVE